MSEHRAKTATQLEREISAAIRMGPAHRSKSTFLARETR